MDRFSVYYAGFSASHAQGISHTILANEVRTHGHDWRVRLEAKGDEAIEISNALTTLCLELHGRTLEDMMPGASTTATGVATWLMERLSLKYPTILRLDVSCAGHESYVTREPRRTT
jgi:6-pyruvoyl-tetrahydropterin synthase